MFSKRVIPTLLMDGEGLYKTKNFKNAKYIGDPINSVKIFNEKEVDELVFIDISKSKDKLPNFEMLEEIASEAFMPLAYAGGLTKIEDVERVLRLGFEKVIINSAAYTNIPLISACVKKFGSQSIVGCIDIHRTFFGKYKIYSHKKDLLLHINDLVEAGIGELLIQNVDREGTLSGYDLELMRFISESVSIPVVASGGAGSLDNVRELFLKTKCTGAAVGSLFVYYGSTRSVLINYPERSILKELI